MNHYDKLGVTPDATEDEIKKAYRARAREKHPDKGGAAEEFASIAGAYEVLKDPVRRQLYDATGRDSREPIEKEIEQILLHLFNEALSQEHDIAIVDYVRTKIKIGGSTIIQQTTELKNRRTKLETRRDKITSTAETNIAHLVIDAEIKRIDNTITELAHQEEVRKLVLANLDTYSEDWKAPERSPWDGQFRAWDGQFRGLRITMPQGFGFDPTV